MTSSTWLNIIFCYCSFLFPRDGSFEGKGIMRNSTTKLYPPEKFWSILSKKPLFGLNFMLSLALLCGVDELISMLETLFSKLFFVFFVFSLMILAVQNKQLSNCERFVFMDKF